MGEISEALRRAQRVGRAKGPMPPAEGRRAPRPAVDETRSTARVRIGTDTGRRWAARAVHVDQEGLAAEHYRHFGLRLTRALRQRGARSVLLTSAAREEGKTTTACNLALGLASMAGGRRLVLVDLDLRRPALAEALDVTPEVGVEAVLGGEAPVARALLQTDLPDLDLCLAVRRARRPLDLLSGPGLAALFKELCRSYDVVLVDTPPVLPVPDVPLILPHVDAAVVVARAGRSRRGGLDTLMGTLEREKVLGLFLNEAPMSRRMRYYGYYGYGRGDDEASGRDDP